MASLYLSSQPLPSAPGMKRKRDVCMEELPVAQGMDEVEPGRTMKRWRNGRPSDEAVHQYTLQKLFSAQTSSPPPHDVNAQAQKLPFQQRNPIFPASKPSNGDGNASGFLKLMASRGTSSVSTTAAVETTICEDCDGRMELSPLEGDEQGRCWRCSRRVCENGCSIAVGDGCRVCLECAVKS
ncbi:hypothetical protein RUND412_004875 [Rhizina undulata]